MALFAYSTCTRMSVCPSCSARLLLIFLIVNHIIAPRELEQATANVVAQDPIQHQPLYAQAFDVPNPIPVAVTHRTDPVYEELPQHIEAIDRGMDRDYLLDTDHIMAGPSSSAYQEPVVHDERALANFAETASLVKDLASLITAADKTMHAPTLPSDVHAPVASSQEAVEAML